MTDTNSQHTCKIIGRLNTDGNVDLVYAEDGYPVCQLPQSITPTVYPVGSQLSAYYEHAEGIVLTPEDAARLGGEYQLADLNLNLN